MNAAQSFDPALPVAVLKEHLPAGYHVRHGVNEVREPFACHVFWLEVSTPERKMMVSEIVSDVLMHAATRPDSIEHEVWRTMTREIWEGLRGAP